MEKGRRLLLSLLSGVLLKFSWPETGWVPVIFVSWIPLLLVHESLVRERGSYNNLKMFGFAFLSFLVWNVGATWWVVNASMGGALLAFFANSMLMAGVFTLFHASRRRFPFVRAVWMLPVFWLAFEFLHHDWDLSWPWLSLGNAFAGMHQIVQWYEFTGSSGGSLWVLIINITLAGAYIKIRDKSGNPLPAIRSALLILIVPVALSLVIYLNVDDKGVPVKVAVIQPNVDPYNEKFSRDLQNSQLENFLRLAEKVTDAETRWLLGPETALAGSIDERFLDEDPRILRIKEWMGKYPKLNILMGAETHKIFTPGEELSSTAREISASNGYYYDAYNTAVLINAEGIKVYHKSKLVPGVEQMPFPEIFRHIEALAIDMGGTTGTLGIQDERTVFPGMDSSGHAAPSICYESVFGDFMRKYVAGGADFIAIITNDGWWGDTPGYKQHLAYARLRAIENRRSIARSANTGVSCFVDQRGDIHQAQPYWQEASISGIIHLNPGRTLFSLTGDVLGRSMVYLAVILLVWSYYSSWQRRKL